MIKNLLFYVVASVMLSGCIVTDDMEYETLDTSKSGLKLYITFDSKSAKDISGNGMNGLLGGSRFITNTPSGEGYAYNIVMESEYLSIPYNPFLYKTDYSVCFWVRDPSQGLLMNTYGKDTDSSYDNFPSIRISDNLLYASFDYGGANNSFNYNPSTIIQNGDWHYLAVTVNEKLQTLYVDGVRVSTQQVNVDESESSELYFGGSLNYYSGASMKIDNIRVYNRAINSDEINLIYREEGM